VPEQRELANEKSIFFHKKWPLPLLTTLTFLFPLSSSGTKSATLFLGTIAISQSIPLALEMASSCEHPDARWLTETCAGKDVTTKEDAKRVFLLLARTTLARCVSRGYLVTFST